MKWALISQRMEFFIDTAVKTSSLAPEYMFEGRGHPRRLRPSRD
jgi:hypothetical protein